METKVSAVKHQDIRGREQLYVVIERGQEKAIINVGSKTYEAVNNVLNTVDNAAQVDNKNKKN